MKTKLLISLEEALKKEFNAKRGKRDYFEIPKPAYVEPAPLYVLHQRFKVKFVTGIFQRGSIDVDYTIYVQRWLDKHMNDRDFVIDEEFILEEFFKITFPYKQEGVYIEYRPEDQGHIEPSKKDYTRKLSCRPYSWLGLYLDDEKAKSRELGSERNQQLVKDLEEMNLAGITHDKLIQAVLNYVRTGMQDIKNKKLEKWKW
jgi:hypothetical protein